VHMSAGFAALAVIVWEKGKSMYPPIFLLFCGYWNALVWLDRLMPVRHWRLMELRLHSVTYILQQRC
jgi:hypothetical protein